MADLKPLTFVTIRATEVLDRLPFHGTVVEHDLLNCCCSLRNRFRDGIAEALIFSRDPALSSSFLAPTFLQDFSDWMILFPKVFDVMTANKLDPYVHLMKLFVENEIDGNEFERRYLSTFKSDTNSWTEVEYENLNYLFAEVDVFCGDPELRDENDIDEEQLREATRKTLVTLEKVEAPKGTKKT